MTIVNGQIKRTRIGAKEAALLQQLQARGYWRRGCGWTLNNRGTWDTEAKTEQRLKRLVGKKLVKVQYPGPLYVL